VLRRPMLIGHHHAGACNSRALPTTGPSNRHGRTLDQRTYDDQARMPVKTTLEAVSRQAQESSRHPRKPEFAINSPQRQRFTRTTVTPGLLYASTPSLYASLCSMLVSCLPLAYKKMRQSPSCGEHTSHISHNISQCSSHSPYP
jgi:hypothetical protein